mmetsp:Transcript_46369/g.68060  ORF Transcript_46369/g.68060 Transcript_46369/m.68060 type:complete len:296 (-) Transcript_46369:5047-5934(-)
MRMSAAVLDPPRAAAMPTKTAPTFGRSLQASSPTHDKSEVRQGHADVSTAGRGTACGGGGGWVWVALPHAPPAASAPPTLTSVGVPGTTMTARSGAVVSSTTPLVAMAAFKPASVCTPPAAWAAATASADSVASPPPKSAAKRPASVSNPPAASAVVFAAAPTQANPAVKAVLMAEALGWVAPSRMSKLMTRPSWWVETLMSLAVRFRLLATQSMNVELARIALKSIPTLDRSIVVRFDVPTSTTFPRSNMVKAAAEVGIAPHRVLGVRPLNPAYAPSRTSLAVHAADTALSMSM